MELVKEQLAKRAEIPARVKRNTCEDVLDQSVCQNAKSKKMCDYGAFGGFGSTIRSSCMATCNIC